MVDHAQIERFLKTLFGAAHDADGEAFVCSLLNDRLTDGSGGERKILTRALADVTAHAGRWDTQGRGCFVCVNLVRLNARKRAKDTISHLVAIHADVDLKDLGIGRDEVFARIEALACAPTMIVDSGNGFHLYWVLPEPLSATPDNIALVEMLNGLALDVVGGDQAAKDISRLLRLPGTHNTKAGGWKDVSVVRDDGPLHDVADLDEWLSVQSPVIQRIAPERAVAPENPFLVAAKRLGFKPPIDVEQRLAAMSYQGIGDTSIHQTQLQVTASLLTRGVEMADVVDTVIEATRAAAGAFAERWNWRREEIAVRRMCEAWIKKNPPSKAIARKVDEDEVRQVVNGLPVVSLSDERQKRKAQPRTRADIVAAIAEGVIEAVRQDGCDLILTEGELHVYQDGVWRPITPADEQWLRTLIQAGCEALGEAVKPAALNGAWKRLNEHPDLYRRKVEWEVGGVITAQNGTLNPLTLEFGPYAPRHFARRKIGVDFAPSAHCSRFQSFIANLFEDQVPDERAGRIALLQEFAGAALAPRLLSREERKAIILEGPSRTGKTEFARIIRGLVGGEIAAPSVAEISNKDFGLQSFYGAAAWIRDDAINEGDRLDPQRFKTIVTGEMIEINRKNRDPIRVELQIPVLLTTNSLPRARDGSEAIFNRSFVVGMTNVIDEEEAHRARSAAGCPRGKTLGQHLFDTEGPGILNWALDGLKRLIERGRYAAPSGVQATNTRFRDDNNPVHAWASIALVRDPFCKVTRDDLRCSFNGWQREEEGDEARAWGARAFLPKLRAAAPWANCDHQEHVGERFVKGVRLTEAGVEMWRLHHASPLKNGTTGSSSDGFATNKAFDKENQEVKDDDIPRF